jgi:hypothetical protein
LERTSAALILRTNTEEFLRICTSRAVALFVLNLPRNAELFILKGSANTVFRKPHKRATFQRSAALEAAQSVRFGLALGGSTE